MTHEDAVEIIHLLHVVIGALSIIAGTIVVIAFRK
jgi:hypothetical protein